MSGSINLTQSLVQKLGSSIVRGELPAGKPLPIEAELGKKFGASRTVMREAVKILSTKGLIGQRPRVGTYVHPEEKWDLLDAEVLKWILDRHFSHKLVREFLEVRIGIEPAAAALAAANATDADKELLKQKLEKMKAANEGHFDPGGRRHRVSRHHPRDQPQPFLSPAHAHHRNGAAFFDSPD